MGVIAIQCPRTGVKVSTGREMSRAEFAAMPFSIHMTFHCWMCGQDHDWSRRWATFVADATGAEGTTLVPRRPLGADVEPEYRRRH